MDRNRKRKADATTQVNSASKRQKLPAHETPQSTTESGLRLVDSLKSAKDKTGRSISELFLSLPSKRDLPEYYQIIKLPIAIDTVENKLRRHAYTDLTTVESDFKRMVANAKLFNDDKSLIYGDAERVRKLLSNWMKTNNPAYNDPDYTAFPTPVPGEEGSDGGSGTPDRQTRERSTTVDQRPRKPTITLSRGAKETPGPKQEKETTATTTTTETHIPAEASEYVGKTFQQAQEQVVQALIDYVDDEELAIYDPFRNLPPRSLADYYQVIKHPMSLNLVKKRIQGKHGRDAATGVTDFKTWDSFENEVSYIWQNCRTYNEDGSEMYNLAAEFEEHFKKELETAKSIVDEPQGPKISLKARPKATLHLGAKSSPAPTPSGVAVDDDALVRQKELVQAGVNGRQTPQPRPSISRSGSQTNGTAAAVSLPSMELTKSQSGAAASPATAVKPEANNASPVRNGIRQTSLAPEPRQISIPPNAMPPPSTTRLPSGSPHPSSQPLLITAPVPSYAPAPVTFLDSFSRTTPISDALLSSLNISTHPQLHLKTPLHINVPPHPDFTHQSLTLMLAASQYYLQLTPTVSPPLSSGSRGYKLFVTVNGTRVSPTFKTSLDTAFADGSSDGINGTIAVGGAGGGGGAGTAGSTFAAEKKQVYDAPLNPGVNRIEIEIVAAPPAGKGGQLEIEKISVFANLMRN